jgi:hypothetical protein
VTSKPADYYLDEPGFVLVPIEHLGPSGTTRELAALLRSRCGWSAERIRLLDAGFTLYWSRATS